MEADCVAEIVERYRGQRGAMISILEEVQARYGYLPEQALRQVADATGRPLVDVYGVATFYRAFSLEPRGKHVCTVCLGTACHVRGAPAVVSEFEKRLAVKPGETTSDEEFTLETVACLGACALGPIVVADGHYFSNVTSGRVGEIIDRTRAGFEAITPDGETPFPLEVGCARCNRSLMDPAHLIEDHASISLVAFDGHEHAPVRFSCLLGSRRAEAGSFAAGTVLRLYCPHCSEDLSTSSLCRECDAPLVPLMVRLGGILQICTRVGCQNRVVDLSGVNV